MIKLKSKNLELRTLMESDAENIVNNLTPNVLKWLPNIPWPYSIDNADDYIRKSLNNLANNTGYDFGIIVKDKLIGTISLIYIKNGKARLAYLLNEEYWNRGIMTEAVSSTLKFGFEQLLLNEIYTGVIKENVASYKILNKFGFKNKEEIPKGLLVGQTFYDEMIMVLKY